MSRGLSEGQTARPDVARLRRCQGTVVPRRLSARVGVGGHDGLAALAVRPEAGERGGGGSSVSAVLVSGATPSIGMSSGAPHCNVPYNGSSLAAEPRCDELVGLGDDLVVDQNLAVQVGAVGPVDRDLHPRQLGVGENRVDLECLTGQHRGLGAVDVRVIHFVRDDRATGRPIGARAVDDVVEHLGRGGVGCGLWLGLGLQVRPSAGAGINCNQPTAATAARRRPSAFGGTHATRHYRLPPVQIRTGVAITTKIGMNGQPLRALPR